MLGQFWDWKIGDFLVNFATKSWVQNSKGTVLTGDFGSVNLGTNSSNGHGTGGMISNLWILLTLIQVSSLCSMVE